MTIFINEIQISKFKKMKVLKFALSTALLFTVLFAHAQCSSNYKKKSHHASYSHQAETVVDIALNSEVHKTLVSALQAADLVEALQANGPFTVFAPTDNAFAKVPKKALTDLLKESNKSQLQKVLTYHVVPARVDASTLLSAIKAGGGMYEIKTLSGDKLTAKIQNGEPVLIDENNGVSIIRTTDLKANNGIIHVIDGVVLPK